MSAIIDDKSSHCIPFILKAYEEHLVHSFENKRAPLFVGLNGVQGCGKSTLVTTLAKVLREEHGLETLVLSLDDLYLTREKQVKLAEANPENPLIQHRGEAGTHDLDLATNVFEHLRKNETFRIPSYDKSAYAGAGDRLPYKEGTKVNLSGHQLKIIILEGWMVGFKALSDDDVVVKHKSAAADSTLAQNRVEDLLFINEKLRAYETLWDQLEVLVHIDAEDLKYVYDWRLEAEQKLRQLKGVENAMTNEQVKTFVDGYFPAYELYTQGLRESKWGGKDGKKLRMVVDKQRKVKSVETVLVGDKEKEKERLDARLALGGPWAL